MVAPSLSFSFLCITVGTRKSDSEETSQEATPSRVTLALEDLDHMPILSLLFCACWLVAYFLAAD